MPSAHAGQAYRATDEGPRPGVASSDIWITSWIAWVVPCTSVRRIHSTTSFARAGRRTMMRSTAHTKSDHVPVGGQEGGRKCGPEEEHVAGKTFGDAGDGVYAQDQDTPEARTRNSLEPWSAGKPLPADEALTHQIRSRIGASHTAA